MIEANDRGTLAAIERLRLPSGYRVIMAPAGRPQTKPRALNVALQFARGDFLVVYDAEDEPEPGQLRAALAGFAAEPVVACLQARLAIDNAGDSWLTRGMMAQTPQGVPASFLYSPSSPLEELKGGEYLGPYQRPIMLDPLPGSVLLTLDDVKRIRDERNALAAKVRELQTKLASLDSKLDAIRLFIDPDLAHQLLGGEGREGELSERPEINSRSKWAVAIIPMLTECGHGLNSKQIRSRLSEELQAAAGVHGHSLYVGLTKLVAKGSLIKDGEYYCLPGQGRPLVEEASGRGVYEGVIRSALNDAPDGLTSGEMISELRKGPMGSRIGKSTGYFYKVLAEMLFNGELTKEGKKYRVSEGISQ